MFGREIKDNKKIFFDNSSSQQCSLCLKTERFSHLRLLDFD